MTAHHWRSIRARLANAGIADPLSMPSLHALCDVTEAALLESISDADERTKLLDKLYAPEAGRTLNGSGYQPQPAGFDDDDVEASFDAFISAAR